MKNTKENRKAILKKQFAEFGKSCYLICTNYKDKADEVFELPVTNYRTVARQLVEKFKSEHPGFCVCSVCWGDGCKGKCYSI